jgi:hypothetical protein
MAALTVAQKLTIAKICEYLVAAAIEKGGLFGNGIDLLLPQKIYNIRKAIQYRYDTDPSDDTLTATSNYLYGLCKYVIQAQAVMQISGTVSSVIATTAPSPYQFTVAASGTFMIDGDSSKTITAFIGYNILFVRGGIPQSTVSSEPSYYGWDRNTGTFTISPVAYTGELFQIYPV